MALYNSGDIICTSQCISTASGALKHIECNWNGAPGLCSGVPLVMGIHCRAQLSSKTKTNPSPILSFYFLFPFILSKLVAGVKTGGTESLALPL